MSEAERAEVRPKYWAEAVERRPVKAAMEKVVFILSGGLGLEWVGCVVVVFVGEFE
jgi:hypothetical protein